MIVVKNTKELEKKYDLNMLRDDECVRIEGGLGEKGKYNKKEYFLRTTYTIGTMKKIIQQMQTIENKIPKEWNELQKAKYIYTILGKNIEYEYDERMILSGICSNLIGLITGKSVCAGYSLIFKEMMDRQGIQCDYIRGIGIFDNSREKHAWNVLTIQGKSFPIDLTWDSARMNTGINELEYFGNDPSFFKFHKPDNDEKKYNYILLNKENVNSIDISRKPKESRNISELQKGNAINYAIEKTYKKYEGIYGEKMAVKHVKANIKKYIVESNVKAFTRDGGAREVIVRNVTSDDMIRIVIDNYVRKCNEEEKKQLLDHAIIKTAQKYGQTYVRRALEDYIRKGYVRGFTRDGNARNIVQNQINNDKALDVIVTDFVKQRVQQIQNMNNQELILESERKKYFSSSEMAAVDLSEKKKANIIKRAMLWIKEKTKEYVQQKPKDRSNEIEKEDNVRQKEEHNEI